VIHYGTWPDQGRSYFRLDELTTKLSHVFRGRSEEAAIYAGLEALTNELLTRTWGRQDGTDLKIERLLVDEGYQTDVVHQFCRATKFAALVMPAKGFGVKAGNKPLNEYEKRPGEKLGIHCRIQTTPGRSIRHLLIDTNNWKTFVMGRLAAPLGASGCLSLFGREPVRHRMFADQLTSESCVNTFGRGRQVTEWSPKPGRRDNHWFDCLTGATCAASLLGCSLTGQPVKAFDGPRQVSFAAQQAAARSRGSGQKT